MNHIYRLIWSVRTGTWAVVAETARSRGKGSGRSLRVAARLMFFIATCIAGSASAETPTTVIPASGKTNAYVSSNGVPVVNIETANGAGLSHNRYTRFNVESKGLVLNNGNSSVFSRQSQLAGEVTANTNLTQEAKVILNEVVSSNRSTLSGFTEVLGGKADVILANPYGITCTGCGFINTDRVTFTTGTPTVAVDGSLTGFTVNRGDVLMNDANLSTQQIFDIVARSVKLDGTLSLGASGSLGITTGNNIWSYISRNVTGSVAGSGTAPSYAIDSTALGGMYAGRIRLIATEAGVGVRMLGQAAASADDFTLTSAGKIEIQSAVSAERDTSITTTSASGIQDLYLNGMDAKLSAKRDTVLLASTGDIYLNDGELFTTRNLTITGSTLHDTSGASKTRFSGGENTITFSGAISIDGTSWGAGSVLNGSVGSFSVGSKGATIYSGTTLDLTSSGDLALGTAAVRSSGNMTLTSSSGAINISAASAQGIQTTAGNLSLTAGNGMTSAGTLTADIGSVTTRVSGLLINLGTIHAKTMLDMADKNNAATADMINSGTLIADGSFKAKAAGFINQSGGNVQGTTGTTFTGTNLTNYGTFIASSTAGQSGNFTLTSLTNSGTLQSSEDLLFSASSTFSNSGKLLATSNVTVNAGTSPLAITNASPGIVQAGATLTFSGPNATFSTQSGTLLGNTAALTLSNLNNSGILQSNAGMTLTIGKDFTNSGNVLATTTLISNSDSLTNSGTIQARQGATITTTGELLNSGTLITSDSATQTGTLNLGTLNNTSTGFIQSAQNMSLNLLGSTLVNSGTIIAANDLSLTSKGSGLSITNQTGGYLQAGSLAGDTLTIDGAAVTLNTSAKSYALGNQLALTLNSLTNEGVVQGGTAASMITATGAIANSGTLTLATSSAGSGALTAASISNTGTLQSSASIELTVDGALVNAGALLSGATLVSKSSSLNNSGTLQANQGASVTVTGELKNSGVITASDSTSSSGTFNVATLDNSSGGVIQSAKNLTLNFSGNTFTNSGKVISNQNLTVNSAGIGLTLINKAGGYLQAGVGSNNTLILGGSDLVLKNTGGNLLGDRLLFTLASMENDGIVQGGAADSRIDASGAVINNGTVTLASSSSSAGIGIISAGSLHNNGTLQSNAGMEVQIVGKLNNLNTIYV